MIFAALAENFIRKKIGNAKASSCVTLGSVVMLGAMKTTQKAGVAKMSLLIFITEPKSWNFSPIQENLDTQKNDMSAH